MIIILFLFSLACTLREEYELAQLDDELCYKQEGRWLNSRCGV
jgi:hypothetical protein